MFFGKPLRTSLFCQADLRPVRKMVIVSFISSFLPYTSSLTTSAAATFYFLPLTIVSIDSLWFMGRFLVVVLLCCFLVFFPPSLKPKPEICSELRKISMSLGIGLLLNCSVCVCVCARNLPAKNASGALPNCWGPKKGPFLLHWPPSKSAGGGEELPPPPLAPRSLRSTSVQACSLLALSLPICYRHFWPV